MNLAVGRRTWLGWLPGRARRWPRATPGALDVLDRLKNPADDMLRVLVEQSPIGMAVIDGQGRLVRVNAALRRLISRDCDISAGNPVAGIFCAEQSPGAWEEVESVLQGLRPARSFVTVLHGKGDGVQAVELSVVPLHNGVASVSGAVLQLVDLSAQKKLETQLTQSQKLQAVGQLAGGIAHDFNNLLTAMIGAADEALERGQHDPDTLDDLRQIRSSAERGSALVRQLLAFGRQQALQPCPVLINAAVQSLSALLRRLLGSGVEVVLELEELEHTVRVDPTQLDRVLVNLAVNARDAMPGGGQLTLRTGHIDLYRALVRGEETIPPGRYVMVEVQDQGVGIPREVLPRIFEPFFTTRRERGGTGLGLSTVHGIVRQSDGFLAVDSAVGKGTRVRIYLPRLDPSEVAEPLPSRADALAAALAPLPSPPMAAAARTVLLVDDEDGVRRLAERAMVKRGWRVLSAPSGEGALAMLAEQAAAASLSAVISDVVMPGMDGAALVRAVRAIRPGLPAILASGYAEEAVKGQLAGEDVRFLPKPYTLKALIATVEALVPALAPQVET